MALQATEQFVKNVSEAVLKFQRSSGAPNRALHAAPATPPVRTRFQHKKDQQNQQRPREEAGRGIQLGAAACEYTARAASAAGPTDENAPLTKNALGVVIQCDLCVKVGVKGKPANHVVRECPQLRANINKLDLPQHQPNGNPPQD